MQRRRRKNNTSVMTTALSLREIAETITSGDMSTRLNRLAKEGRRDDCLALMQELGDWQSCDPDLIAEVLYIPDLTHNLS